MLEAQIGPDPGFLRLLQQEASIHAWQVVVITPSRQLNVGASEPVAEFLALSVDQAFSVDQLEALAATTPHLVSPTAATASPATSG